MLKEEFSVWHCGSTDFSLTRPRIMGILNVTPDSFSDGGENLDTDSAIARGLEMLDQGADIIDVGGESTRPGFEPVSVEEEGKRIVPVVKALVDAGAVVSVDTRHAEVARMCVRLGAQIVNDVSGFTQEDMIELAAEGDFGCVVMHSGAIEDPNAPRSGMRRQVVLDTAPQMREQTKLLPQPEAPQDEDGTAAEGAAQDGDALRNTMHTTVASYLASGTRAGAAGRRRTLPDEAPIMRQVMGFLGDRARALMRAGVDARRICVDPGCGFGKTAEEDIVIQRNMAKMASMGYPLMCAVSRKRVVGVLTGTELEDRDMPSAAMAIAAAQAGARILRVHDVAGTARALNGFWGIAHPNPKRAFVALGSNVGDRMAYLARACREIDAIPLTSLVATSKAYESEPAYGIATPVANCVVEIRTELAPLVLLDALLEVENKLGRVRNPGEEGHGPRTMDCDLIWMEGEVHAGRKLTLPHKGIAERDFVLTPLADLQNDPARFLAQSGIQVVDEDKLVGKIRRELGEIAWE